MPAFQYLALDADGRRRRGPLEADTPRAARAQLRAQGLTPLRVEAISEAPAGGARAGRRTHVSAAGLALATRQLATLIGSGLPVERALAAAADASPGGRLAGVLLAVRARVTEGHTLAAALGEFPRVFPELYRALGAARPCDLIAVPSAFTHVTGRAHWELLLRARAVENQCYVIAPAQGGLHETGRRTWGHSMVVDPWGEVLAVREEGEGVVLAELDPARIAEVRMQLPALEHRRL